MLYGCDPTQYVSLSLLSLWVYNEFGQAFQILSKGALMDRAGCCGQNGYPLAKNGLKLAKIYHFKKSLAGARAGVLGWCTDWRDGRNGRLTFRNWRDTNGQQ